VKYPSEILQAEDQLGFASAVNTFDIGNVFFNSVLKALTNPTLLPADVIRILLTFFKLFNYYLI
jgi:hypothetical protein